MSIDSIPPNERPRERCLTQSASCLSLRECLALILGSGPKSVGCLGLASQILERSGRGLEGQDQMRAFFKSMEVSAGSLLGEISGLGDAGQAKILAAFELGRRYSVYRQEYQRLNRKDPFQRSVVAMKALHAVDERWRNEPQEWLGFIPVHRNGKLGDLCIVERGVRTHVNVEPGELFARILSVRPSGFYLFHNHPSGDLTPSGADLDLTGRVRRIAQQLGLELMGHWIVSVQGETWIAATEGR